MKPCPVCGEMLAPGLVAAIADATAEESCPKDAQARSLRAATERLERVRAAMMATALVVNTTAPAVDELVITVSQNRPCKLAEAVR